MRKYQRNYESRANTEKSNSQEETRFFRVSEMSRMLVKVALRDIRLFAVFVIYGKVTSGKFARALLVARPTSAVQNRNSAS